MAGSIRAVEWPTLRALRGRQSDLRAATQSIAA